MVAALDSNVFIAFLSRDDAFYRSALDIIKQIDSGKTKAVCSSIVYGEIVYTARRKDTLSEVEHFFQQLSNCTAVPADKKVCIEAAKLRFKYTSLRLPDAIHLASALHANADVFVTADKRLAKIAKQEIKTNLLGTSTI